MKGKTGRYLWLLVMVWVCCTMTVTGCGLRDQTDYFAYQDRAFAVTVRGTLCRTAEDGYEAAETDFWEGASQAGKAWSFAATVSVKPPDGDGVGSEASVAFSEPVSLKGITATRRDGTVTVTLGDMVLTDAEEKGQYDGLLRVVEVLLAEAEIVSVTATEGMTEVRVKTNEGNGQFTFEDGGVGALPKRARWSNARWQMDVRIDEVNP